MSKYRKSMSDKHSQKNFTANAGVHPKNVNPRPARGGIRL